MIGDPTALKQYLRDSSPSVYNRTDRTVFLVFSYPVTAATLFFKCELFSLSNYGGTGMQLQVYNTPDFTTFDNVVYRAELASLCVLTIRVTSAGSVAVRRNGSVRFAGAFAGSFDPTADDGREFAVTAAAGQYGETARFGEWLVFDSALSDADCAKIENYLMQKFGI